jgi:four helix bundle protein
LAVGGWQGLQLRSHTIVGVSSGASLPSEEPMNKSNYRDLVVWQKGRTLTVEIYRATRQFPREEIFGLTRQMRRAALSSLCNIAEAHGRRSVKDRMHFLDTAHGSLLELEAQLVISGDLEFLPEGSAEE